VLELAGNAARDVRCETVLLRHVAGACAGDEELAILLGRFCLPGYGPMGVHAGLAHSDWYLHKESKRNKVNKEAVMVQAPLGSEAQGGPVSWEARQLLRLHAEAAALSPGPGAEVLRAALALAGGAPRFVSAVPTDAALRCSEPLEDGLYVCGGHGSIGEGMVGGVCGVSGAGDMEDVAVERAPEPGIGADGDSDDEADDNEKVEKEEEEENEEEDEEEDEEEEEEEEDEEEEDAAWARHIDALMALPAGCGNGGGDIDGEVDGIGFPREADEASEGGFLDALDFALADCDGDARQLRLLRNPLLTNLESDAAALRFPNGAIYRDPAAVAAQAAALAAGAAAAPGFEVSRSGVEWVRLARRAGVLAIDLPSAAPALEHGLRGWLDATLGQAVRLADVLNRAEGQGRVMLGACVRLVLDAPPLAAGPTEEAAEEAAGDAAAPDGGGEGGEGGEGGGGGGSGPAEQRAPLPPGEPPHLRPLTRASLVLEEALGHFSERGWMRLLFLAEKPCVQDLGDVRTTSGQTRVKIKILLLYTHIRSCVPSWCAARCTTRRP